MGLKAGIIGLPNAGKSTIFNALTKSGIPAENYPFCTIDPNVGIVSVPDSRLYELANIFKPMEITPATMEFVDIAGLVKGASHGEGLGNQFLSHIRDVDAMIHVVRLFEDENVSHVEGTLDPIRDIEIVETELILRDIASVDKRIEKLTKTARIGDKESKIDLDVLKIILPRMNDGIMVHDIKLEKDQLRRIRQMALLTSKPTLYVANVDEDEILAENRGENIQKLFVFAEKRDNAAIRLCGNLEAEITTLSDKEKPAFLLEYKLPEAGLDKLIHASYRLLGLETFFTGGDKQVRAWTLKKGTSASRAAGEIHTDMERGFIKAEIYASDELISFGSELALREAGKIRQEGKNYTVLDGDVIFFKFNV